MLLIAEDAAKANNRDIIAPWDLPITKGLQESIHKYKEIDKKVSLRPIFEKHAGWPPLDRLPDYETQERLPDIMGGLSFALAKSFKSIWPDLKNPETQQLGRHL